MARKAHMPLNKFSLNGTIQSLTKATISVTNIEYAYGFGVYETIRVSKGISYFLDQHIERLIFSAQVIGLEHELPEVEIKQNVEELIEKLGTTDAYNLKAMLIGAKASRDCLLYIFPSAPLFPDRRLYKEGVATLTVAFERAFPNAKTLSMLPSYLAMKKAKQSGCYDALAVDRDGYITEGTMTNFFLVKDNTIYSPPKAKILDGVTQRIVLQLAAKNGFVIEEGLARVSELSNYDGAFLTSTSSKVMPVKSIDDYQFSAIADSTKAVAKLYDDYLANCKGNWKG